VTYFTVSGLLAGSEICIHNLSETAKSKHSIINDWIQSDSGNNALKCSNNVQDFYQ
jgi:hypothetical protein